MAAPATPFFGPAIDSYADYDGQDTCDPNVEPGVDDFRSLLVNTYGSYGKSPVPATSATSASTRKAARLTITCWPTIRSNGRKPTTC
ncbi:MAG TPA: hypothetical protein VFC19_42865 [Candidatus Limnocylindrales bacterium]|nr:hypothetical protein [Candidatus Limnocylindrales bacterium]